MQRPFGIAAVLFLMTGGLAIGLAGCPSNSCFLKVCSGNDCHCSLSSCQDGAGYDTNQSRCRCLKGYLAVAGQCLTQEAANQYCGVGHHFAGTGCVKSQCQPGDELDLSTGWCIPKQRVDEVATNMGVEVGEGQKLGCPAGQELVIDGDTAACVPISQTCAPDEVWTGQACNKIVNCPTGQQWDTAVGQCVTYAQSTGDALNVNVNQWVTTNYGPNGGTGTPAFCGGFAKKPWSFGVTEGNTAMIRIAVTVQFPDAEIQRATVQTQTNFEFSGNAVPQKGAGEVQTAAANVLAPLAKGGGKATAPSVTTTVRCPVINAAKPLPVPATAGV